MAGRSYLTESVSRTVEKLRWTTPTNLAASLHEAIRLHITPGSSIEGLCDGHYFQLGLTTDVYLCPNVAFDFESYLRQKSRLSSLSVALQAWRP